MCAKSDGESKVNAKSWFMLAVTPQLIPVFLGRDILPDALKQLCLMTTPSAAASSHPSMTHRSTEVYTFPGNLHVMVHLMWVQAMRH